MKRSTRIRNSGVAVFTALLAGTWASCTAPEPPAKGPPVSISPAESLRVPLEFRMPGAPPVCPLLRADTPPKIDGRLDEPLWKSAPRLGRMYLDTGEGPMKFDTIARLARDEEHLYLAVECLHPAITEVPVRQGIRDKVSWAGETVELWVDTDPGGEGYVQVIFDMSGAFTDMFKGSSKWNGNIEAATDVGGTGWRLEARLKIADLGGDGKIDRCLWGANVARNTRGQSGSWARIVSNYQKPDEFGLLTHSGNEVVVEDVGLGIFAPPGEKDQHVPVRLDLCNLTARPAHYKVSVAALRAGKAGRPFVRTVLLPASGARRVLGTLDIRKSEKVRVAIAPAKGAAAALFQADLPIHRLARPEDCLVSRRLTCAIRSTSPVMLTAKGGDVYLMAQSFLEAPAKWSGRLTIRPLAKRDPSWACPVAIELGPTGNAARLINIPTDRLKPGQYVVEWMPTAEAGGPPLKVRLDYYPDLRKSLADLLRPPVARDVLAKMACPLPAEDRDLALAKVRIDRLVGYLRSEQSNLEIDLTRNILSSYRRLKEVVDGLRSDRKYTARRRGWFETAIFSPVDGSAQPFTLFVPYDYNKQRGRKFALVIQLHGAGGTHGGEAGFMPGKDRQNITDRFILRPLGRGKRCGYGGVPGNDVINQIRQVMALYPIDPDAVHLGGGSMGGFGSFEIGCTHPDLFATCRPLCGGGWWLPLEQMRNLPTFVHHGLADAVVKPWGSIFTVAKMKHYRCPVQLYLHPGIGHGVRPAADQITDWDVLKSIRREPHPRTVVLSGQMPALSKAYWLAIARCADPHRQAYLRGTFVGKNHLDLTARNVAWAKVSLPAKWVDRKAPLQITAGGGRKWAESAPDKAQALYVRLDGENLEVTTQTPAGVDDPSVYLGGGRDRLFCEGRAVRIVYGTAGAPERAARLKTLAETLRTYPNGFDVGGYPLLSDTEVTDQIHQTCDLILIGSPTENAVVAALAKDLPVKFAGDKVVVETEPRMQWPAKDVALTLFYRNPKAPARRIWLVAGANEKVLFEALRDVPHRFGSPQPDLAVLSVKTKAVVGTAVVAGNWKLARPAPPAPANGSWATPRALHDQFAAFLKGSFPVDLSLADVSAALRDPQQTDWKALTVGEALAMIKAPFLVIAPVSGRDLLAWRTSRTEQGRKFAGPWAGLDARDIKPEATYQVLIDTNAASGLEPDGSYRDYRFIPETAVEAVKRRFADRCVKP